MQRYDNVARDDDGNSISGAEITVRKRDTGAVASLFAEDEVTAASNPVVTERDGSFSFYAADGRYSLVASYGNRQYDLPDVSLDSVWHGQVAKAADETYLGGDLHSDDTLTFPIEASVWYFYNFTIFAVRVAGTDPGFRFRMNPPGATKFCLALLEGEVSAGWGNVWMDTAGGGDWTVATMTNLVLHARGFIKMGAPSAVALRWGCFNVATNGATVQAGSYVTWVRCG